MAMIKCKECGKDISDAAVACPQCGCPVEKAPAAAPAAAPAPAPAPAAPAAAPAPAPAPAAPAVSRGKKIMSGIGSVLGVLGVICIILFNIFKDDLSKMAVDERITMSLNDLCEETFKRKPFKIEAKDNNIYEVIWVDPDGKEYWTYTAPKVRFKFFKDAEGNHELDFATDEDRESWEQGKEIFQALN